MPSAPIIFLARLVHVVILVVVMIGAVEVAAASPGDAAKQTQLTSLSDLSIEALRSRRYGTELQWAANLPGTGPGPAYRADFSRDGRPVFDSFIISYSSDDLRVYARVDVPAAEPPASGYPVLLFVHGWVGREAAPQYDFMYQPESLHARLIDRYVAAGFVVVSPGLRGHGTIDGRAAEGIGYLDAWDNSSYLSPAFYAIDVLNLLAGLPQLESIDWSQGGPMGHERLRIDRKRINILGHSQGGDAALIALAVSGEGSTLRVPLAAGSVWSGCFGPRLEQARIYGAMSMTPEAFLAGDGDWTGSAIGRDGSVNPNFVFGYPPESVARVDSAAGLWSWRGESRPLPGVAEALDKKYSEMYRVFNSQVADLGDARFALFRDGQGKARVEHDTRVREGLRHIGAFNKEAFLREPLHLHYSDRDYYSIPQWNQELAARINRAGGRAIDYKYPGNTHSLLVSKAGTDASGELVEGFEYMIERDIALFRDGPNAAPDAEEQLSIAALGRYAARLSNQFERSYERQALDGITRRVVSFRADGLQQYALILQPQGPPPAGGWPALLFNHGYHPDPNQYGRAADGSTDRPGDYYRGLPLAFAQKGLLVVVPDYRGHNDSEGGSFAQGLLAPYWYSRDVVAAFRALQSLPSVNSSRLFMTGHSMGGNVTLRAMLALGNDVRAASLWSSSSAGLLERARDSSRRAAGQGKETKRWRQSLESEIASLPFDFDAAAAEAHGYLDELRTPLNIHHAKGDPTIPHEWSQALYRQLAGFGKTVFLFEYAGQDHFFRDEQRARAIERDLALFLESPQ